MKNKLIWRTRDGRKVCRICARRLKRQKNMERKAA